jgi:hypothetical protein
MQSLAANAQAAAAAQAAAVAGIPGHTVGATRSEFHNSSLLQFLFFFSPQFVFVHL